MLRKRNFTAQSWLGLDKTKTDEELLASSSEQDNTPYLASFHLKKKQCNSADERSRFPLQNLDLEWLSENLLSKVGYLYSQALNLFSSEVLESLLKNHALLSKLKNDLYEEFLGFCHDEAITLLVNDSYDFVAHIKNLKESEYQKEIKCFLQQYSTKVASFYLMKLRLVRILSLQDGEELRDLELLSLNNLFLKHFKKNTTSEFKSSFLQTNIYSWYSPQAKFIQEISSFFESSGSLSFQEIQFVLSRKISFFTLKSNALSHKNFGLFLNSVLINFIDWLEDRSHSKTRDELSILSTKFMGDSIIDLGNAFWLAQHSNSYFKWNVLLCPTFQTAKKQKNCFFRLCNEIEFYTFLVKISSFYSKSTKKFLSKCAQDYYVNTKETFQGQPSFSFTQEENKENSSYNRLVLSLLNLPSSNSWHFVTKKIKENLNTLKDSGYLVLLTTQNLFVPSQKNQLEKLLKKIEIRCSFDLQEIKGKGEIPAYIYVIKKNCSKLLNIKERSVCYNFKFNGELDSINKFNEFTDELNFFWEKYFTEIPPFVHRSFNDKQLQFFQNVIVDGKLIESGDEKSRITHPSFMKNMMKNCVPFHSFFHLASIKEFSQNKYTDQMNFEQEANVFLEKSSDELVLLLNFSQSESRGIEIIHKDLLLSKIDNYGTTDCYYYRLIPKTNNLNLNLFREYFESSIGKQLAEVSAMGSYNQAKSRVLNLYIPKIFNEEFNIKAELYSVFSFMEQSEDEISACGSSSLLEKYNSAEKFFEICKESKEVHSLLSYLSYFKISLSNILKKTELLEKDLGKIDYSLMIFRERLLSFQMAKIYPNNSEVFIEFLGSSLEVINAPLASVNLSFKDEKGIVTLSSTEGEVLKIHSDKYLASFMKFLFVGMKDMKISDLLKSMKVPSNQAIQGLVTNFFKTKEHYQDLYSRVDSEINQTLRHLISL